MDKIPIDKARLMSILQLCSPDEVAEMFNETIDNKLKKINEKLTHKRNALICKNYIERLFPELATICKKAGDCIKNKLPFSGENDVFSVKIDNGLITEASRLISMRIQYSLVHQRKIFSEAICAYTELKFEYAGSSCRDDYDVYIIKLYH